MVLFAEVKLVDNMAGIEFVEVTLHLHLHEVVEVSMATHVEIARDLLDCK
jgi:hypothetical protein